MTAQFLIEEFERSKACDNVGAGVTVRVRLNQLNKEHIQYNVESFGHMAHALTADGKKDWQQIGGWDAYFKFSLWGEVEEPTELSNQQCEIRINPVGTRDIPEITEHGTIGFGTWNGKSLWVKLTLARDVMRDLLDYLSNRWEFATYGADHNCDAMLALCNVREAEAITGRGLETHFWVYRTTFQTPHR